MNGLSDLFVCGIELLDMLNSVLSGWGLFEGVDFEDGYLLVIVNGDIGSLYLENYVKIFVGLDLGI